MSAQTNETACDRKKPNNRIRHIFRNDSARTDHIVLKGRTAIDTCVNKWLTDRRIETKGSPRKNTRIVRRMLICTTVMVVFSEMSFCFCSGSVLLFIERSLIERSFIVGL